MPQQAFTVQYLMTLAPGGGIKKDDMPKGLENVGKQRDWLNASDYGMAVLASLKGAGFETLDVGDEMVFKQRLGGKTTYWVPFASTWQNGFKTLYIPLRVEAAAPSVEDQQEQWRAEFERQKAEGTKRLEEAKNRLELSKIQAEIDALNREAQQGTGTTPGPVPAPMPGNTQPGPTPMTFRTYELFGVWNNASVPLMQVLQRTGTGWMVMPGARVMVATQQNEGFGLSGTPGRWAEFYGGRNPSEFGQDTDKGVLFLDANTRRGYAVPAQQLTEFFGANWRSVLYS